MFLLIFNFEWSAAFFILWSHGNNFFLSHNILLIYIHLWFFCATILASRVRKTNRSKHSKFPQNCRLVQQAQICWKRSILGFVSCFRYWNILVLSSIVFESCLLCCSQRFTRLSLVILVQSGSNRSNESVEVIVLHLPAVNFMKLWCEKFCMVVGFISFFQVSSQ